ncbi:MAG: hypothetical protein DLM70_12840, partial [Chloroflexi bacterium]
MSVRVLHVADMHLGRSFTYLGDVAAVRRRDLAGTFARICAIAVERQVAAVLIAGDLFDSFNPSRAMVELVQTQLGHLQAEGIKAFIVPGDHDTSWYERSVFRTTAFPGAHIFIHPVFDDPQQFEADGVTCVVHGIAHNPMACPDPLQTLRPVDGALNLAILHATVDAVEGVEEDSYLPVSRQDLSQPGLHYIALGHAHARAVYEHAGNVVAAYPGGPESLRPEETGERYVAIVEFSGESPVIEWIPMHGREARIERVNVTGCDEQDVIRKLHSMASDNLLLTAHLVGYPRAVLSLDRIQRALAGAFFWLEIDDHTRLSSSDLGERVAGEAAISGRFVQMLRRRIAATSDTQERL